MSAAEEKYHHPCRACGLSQWSVDVCPACYRACPECGGPPVVIGSGEDLAFRCAWCPAVFALKAVTA